MQATRNSLAGRSLIRPICIKTGEEKPSSKAVNWEEYGCWAECLRTRANSCVIRQQEVSYPQLAEIKVNPCHELGAQISVVKLEVWPWILVCRIFRKNLFWWSHPCNYGQNLCILVKDLVCDYLLYLPQLCGKTFLLFSNGFQLSFIFFITCYAMLRSCFSCLVCMQCDF